jgi:four helix bundle protein
MHTSDSSARFEDGQDIRDRSFEFACAVVAFCQNLSEAGGVGRLMVPQLLACSLSFATMLEEARAAESTADFVSKCSIGLKECRESWTRLRVCARCRIGPRQNVTQLVEEADQLIAIVTAIIRNTKRNSAKRNQTPREQRKPQPGYEFQIPNS